MVTASGGLLGAITALMSESAEQAGDRTAAILPFTAGGFIYIALVTVVPELLQEKSPKYVNNLQIHHLFLQIQSHQLIMPSIYEL